MEIIKIAYLHGLNSNNLGPKNSWLKTVSNLFDPNINYKEPNIYRNLKSKILDFKPNLIIGSSMGGYFAYEIARELNINGILFNPAIHSRSFEPDMNEHEIGMYKPKLTFVFGEKDTVINPIKTQKLIESEMYNEYLIFQHGHDTPLELFKEIVKENIEKRITNI